MACCRQPRTCLGGSTTLLVAAAGSNASRWKTGSAQELRASCTSAPAAPPASWAASMPSSPPRSSLQHNGAHLYLKRRTCSHRHSHGGYAAVGTSIQHTRLAAVQARLLAPTVMRARSLVLTRRSAAAAAGVHTHTYSSAASETAATKKAPGLPLPPLPSPGPGACARMDTDTAACSSDNTPAGGTSVPMIGCRLPSNLWPVLAAAGFWWNLVSRRPRLTHMWQQPHLLRCAIFCWGHQWPARPLHDALPMQPTLHTGHLL